MTIRSSPRLDDLRRSESALMEELRSAGAHIHARSRIKCPFHDDRNPSASMHRADDGVWRYRCFAGSCGFHGDVIDVKARASGRDVGDILREIDGPAALPARPSSSPTPASPKAPTPAASPAVVETAKPSASTSSQRVYPTLDAIIASYENVQGVYRYDDPDTGVIDMVTLRYWPPSSNRKLFVPLTQTTGGWHSKALDAPRPLYRRDLIRKSHTVIVCEGEKCCDALNAILPDGICATTAPGGAASVRHADWTPLRGKQVYLWPDADPPDEKGVRAGIVAMREVAKLLEEIRPAPSAAWIDCDTLELPPKGDAFDYVESCHDDECAREAVLQVLREAEPLGPSGELKSLLRDTISGRRTAIPLPWPILSGATLALLPGAITIVCGDPGASKSFMGMQLLSTLIDAGIACVMLALEGAREAHLLRALAQRANLASALRPDWIREHAAEVTAAFHLHRAHIDAVGRAIVAGPDSPSRLCDVAAWVEAQAEAGARVIIVDPVSLAERSANPWIDDGQFVRRVLAAITKAEVSLVLTTHPRHAKRTGFSLEDVAGGAAYVRHADSVLLLAAHHPPRDAQINDTTKMGSLKFLHPIDRTITVAKARNSFGTGLRIGYAWDWTSCTMREIGVIARQQRAGGDNDN